MRKFGERRTRSVRRMLERVGLHVRRSRNYWPRDWSKLAWSHPLEAIYANGDGNILLTVPLDRIVTLDLHAIPAHRNGGSPFIKTLEDYLERRCETYAGSVLQSFYDNCTFCTAADFLRLTNPSNPGLRAMPVAAGVAPWQAISPDEMLERRPIKIVQENREHGKHDLTAADGHSLYGPVSRKKGELEFERLVWVTERIRRYGWRIDPSGTDNVVVILLLDDNDDYRFVISGAGQHRVAALSALKYKNAIVQLKNNQPVNGVVRRSDASWWPLVQQGWFNETEALDIFDRFFKSF